MNGWILHLKDFNDLDEIRAYIAEDNPDTADRVVTEIFDAIRALSTSQQGRLSNSPRVPLRFILVRDFVIAYSPDKSRCGSSPCSIPRKA